MVCRVFYTRTLVHNILHTYVQYTVYMYISKLLIHEKMSTCVSSNSDVVFELVFLPLPFYDTVVKETKKVTVNIWWSGTREKGMEMER